MIAKSESGFLGRIRVVTLVVLLAGVMSSEILMLRAGGSRSILLVVLFIGWILAPFAALGWATVVSKRWSNLVQATLYCVALLVTSGSLAFYGGVILPPAGSPHAFVFVVGPLVSWAIMAVVVPIAALISRKQ